LPGVRIDILGLSASPSGNRSTDRANHLYDIAVPSIVFVDSTSSQGTKAFLKSRDERKRVEMRFAHLKIHRGFERMRLRGLSGARDEFHLAAIVQNLKTLALRAFRPPDPLRSASFAWASC